MGLESVKSAIYYKYFRKVPSTWNVFLQMVQKCNSDINKNLKQSRFPGAKEDEVKQRIDDVPVLACNIQNVRVSAGIFRND